MRSARRWSRIAGSDRICRIWPDTSWARRWRCPMRRAGGSAMRHRASTCSPISMAISSARRRRARGDQGRPLSARIRARCPRRERELLAREIELHGAHARRRGKDRLQHRAGLRRGSFEPEPFAVRCFVAAHRSRLRGDAGRPRHDGRRQSGGGAQCARWPDPRCVGAVGEASSDRTSACGGRRSRPRASSARSASCKAGSPTTCSGSDATASAPTGPCACCAVRSRIEEDSGPAGGLRAARKCLEVLLDRKAPQAAGKRDRRRTEIERLCAAADHQSERARALCSGRSRASIASPTSRAIDCRSRRGRRCRVPPAATPGSAALAQAARRRRLDFLDEGLASIAAFNGLMHENMTRNFGWSFLDMGRRLERAYNLARGHPHAVHSGCRAGRGDEQPAAAPRTCRQLHHLSLALPARSRCCRWCSICCCSTKPIREVPRLSAGGHCRASRGPARWARGAGLSEDRRLSLSAADLDAACRHGSHRAGESRLGAR